MVTDFKLDPCEVGIFDMFFASLASMSVHPGAGRSNGHAVADKMSFDDCAVAALEMVRIRRRYVSEVI